ncbi:tetronasin ABC transporter integral membrane protein [Tetragenococcus halophilus subsp. flandriensis]|uniref:ABC transporter permease n=1 Tax=Tetragenococcus halophilus TaxID=51669 RepID=UPI0023E94A3C|nr:hypothetical protein [Tetragenococcus halophilus]GMA08345.1 tetronasin ABC transporter integral membrane protein [Tetragenococcus halophilus subsp. flandriensis]
MNKNHFAGTGKLLKLYFRRDRILMILWVLLPIILLGGQMSFVKAMPDWRGFITELSSSPLTSALLGPIVPLSIEGAILWRGILQASIAIMMATAFITIRHTRSEEASGRNELIFGKPIGRYANLSAALILSCGGSLITGLLTTVYLILNGFAVSGSLLAGLTLTTSGFIFAGIGGLCSQIFIHSGSARGAVFGVYGLTMVAMVMNNIQGGDTYWIWFAPEAWFRLTVPFGENDFWPIFFFILLSVLPMVLSYGFLRRRDLGTGLIPQREGSEKASLKLNSTMAFAWRQNKFNLILWVISMAYLGGMMGLATPNISEAISATLAQMNTWGEAVAKLGNQEAFISILIYILGLMAGLSVFAITTIQKLRQEETKHYADIILSRPVSRFKWLGSYLTVAFVGSTLILLALGFAAGLGWAIVSGEFSYLPRVLGMTLSKIPPVWTIIGIAVLIYGWLPRIAFILNWLVLGIFIFIEMFWEVGIVEWSMLQWTPFAYAHYSIPIHELSVFPLIILIIITAAFTWLGLVGFRRRSIG